MSASAEQVPATEQGVEPEVLETTKASENMSRTKKIKHDFIKSLEPGAILALASKHNDNKPCHMFKKSANGSFNVCFFVEFPHNNERWVIRVPILPRLRFPWSKVHGELATINYVEKNTTIPVPDIIAHGDESLTKDTNARQIFMIFDYVEGKPLTKHAILSTDKDTRTKLFEQMFDIFLQLRELKFDEIGSIMFDKDGNPVIKDTLTFSVNTIPGTHINKCSTAAEYMKAQYELLVHNATFPIPGRSESKREFELFAIHSMKTYYSSVIPEEFNNGPFVLHHHDLHLGNFLVDDKLEIQCVIDWEFVHTVPLPLFTPPSWAEGPGLGHLFEDTLEDAAKRDERYKVLFHDWFDPQPDATFINSIIRFPDEVSDVFKHRFAEKLYGDDLAKTQADFKAST